MDNFDESMGVNDRVALARANKVMRNRINTHWMREGVSMIDPETTYIDADVKIGRDTVIEGGVVIKGHTEIGNDCYIGAGSRITDSKIHDGVKIISSTLQEAEMQLNFLHPKVLQSFLPQIFRFGLCRKSKAFLFQNDLKAAMYDEYLLLLHSQHFLMFLQRDKSYH